MKYFEKDEKRIHFLEVWRRDDEEKWWICEWNTVSMWERRTKKTISSKRCSKENWKVLKIILKAQNMHFSQLNQVANKSLSQATKHLRDKIFEKFLKNFLSVFRDWKVHPQGSYKGSRENFCITSHWSFHSWTCCQTKSRKLEKPKILEKNSKSFL